MPGQYDQPDPGAAAAPGAGGRPAAVSLGERIAALMPHGGRSWCIDVATLGIPDQAGRYTAGAGHTPSVSVRRHGESVIVAATPGGDGPCPRCLDRRWLACRPLVERRSRDRAGGVVHTPVTPPGPHVIAIAAALAGVAAACAGDGTPSRPVWTISTSTARVERFALIKDSSCEECRLPPPDTAEHARIRPVSVPVPPGMTRARSPEEFALPMEALANPVCGMLGRPPERLHGAIATAPVSGRFVEPGRHGLQEVAWSGHAESYRRSELLGALEGLERHAGLRSRHAGVAGRAAAADLRVPHVPMERCGLYDPDFYRENPGAYAPWSDGPVVPWVWGWSLRDDRAILVPEQLVYYLGPPTGHLRTVQESSNGCASGASVTEAVLHGLLELIERDAFLIHWYSGLTPPELDLDAVDSPAVRHVRARLDLHGYELRCFDVRVDLPLPAVGAVAVRRDGGIGRLCFAGAAALDPADAVRAAVFEVASFASGLAGRVTASLARLRPMADDYTLLTGLEHHALLFGLPAMARHAEHWLRRRPRVPPAEAFGDWTAGRAPVTDLAAPVRDIVELLAGRGLDTVVVDQTTPEQRSLGLRTVATVVPGLVPIDFGWRRQRALTMPRTLRAPHDAGLTSHPLRPDQLHLVPHPFP